MSLRWIGLLVVALLLPAPLYAELTPRAQATHTTEPPIIDGILDDAVWQQAEIVSEFTQVEPVEGEKPSFRTEVRFLTTDDSLFVSLRAYDPDPGAIVANLMGRDQLFLFDDSFSLVLDTFHDHRNGYFIQVNPHGGRRDGTFEGNSFAQSWDGIWYAKARIDGQGWTAEIELPYQTFSFRPGEGTWGLNMTRRVRRFNEEDRWADPTRDRILINVSRAGVLEGLQGAQQGLGLDAVPSGTAAYINDTIGEDDRKVELEPSFDARYRLLPSLTASVTANTDFSQTALDSAQINMSRFELFFPEQREFFLQDSGIFSFAGLDKINGMPFFSRRIGLAESGDTTRILGGGKLTGRIGRFNIGALNIQQDGNEGVRDTNLSVLRVSANVLEESKVGFIVTHGDPLSNDSNLLGGLDFNYRSNDLVPGRVFATSVWVQQSFSGTSEGEYPDRSTAFGGLISYPNDKVNWRFGYEELQQGFNPALGFANRTDIRFYAFNYRYRFRPTDSAIHTLDVRSNGNLTTDRNNIVRSGKISFQPFKISNQIDDSIELGVTHMYENISDPFFITGHIGVPDSEYHFASVHLDLKSSRNRKLRGSLTIGYGGFYDGTGVRIAPTLEWRPSPHFLFGVDYDERQFFGVRACSGAVDGLGDPLECARNLSGDSTIRNTDFATRVGRFRVQINFTTDISWETFAQYDNVSDQVAAQSRFRWIIEEGRDLYLVVGQDFDASPGDFRVGQTELVVKLRWTLRF